MVYVCTLKILNMPSTGIYLQCEYNLATIEYDNLYYSKSKNNSNGNMLALQINKDGFILGDYDESKRKLINITSPYDKSLINEVDNVVTPLVINIQQKLSPSSSEYHLMLTSNKIRNLVLGIWKKSYDRMRLRMPSNYVYKPKDEQYITVPTLYKHKTDQECLRLEAEKILDDPYYVVSQFDADAIIRAVKHPLYYSIPPASSSATVGHTFSEIKSYLAALKKWFANTTEDMPKCPGFKNSKALYKFSFVGSKQISVNESISFPSLKKFNLSDIVPIDIPSKVTGDIKTVSFVPSRKGFMISITYNNTHKALMPYKDETWMGIDPGIRNILAIETAKTSRVFDGSAFLSEQKHYQDKKAKMQSVLMTNKDNVVIVDGLVRCKKGALNTKRFKALSLKHNNKVGNFVHKITAEIINICKADGITKIFFGQNINWKKGKELKKKNKKAHVQFNAIPHAKILEKLTYKAKLFGIEVIGQEERYTSQCSFLDNEPIRWHSSFQGKRKGGLFKTANGTILNADSNAALNIAKKSLNALVDKGQIINPLPIKWTGCHPKKEKIFK